MRGAPRVAYVWWCGDEECDCTQAVIVERGGGEKVWSGKYRCGGWWDEDDKGPTHELNRLARIMRRKWHDAYRTIEWPWDRTA